MSVPLPLCPNCGTPWPPGTAAVCPNCGCVRPVWPPPPAGFVAPRYVGKPAAGPLAAGPLVTGAVGGDVTLGLSISIAICLVSLSLMTGYGSLFRGNLGWGLGLLAPPVLYFVLRPRYPAVARGLGWGVLTGCILLPFAVIAVLAALALGILSLCSTNGHQ